VPVAGIGCAGEGEGRTRKRKMARAASRRIVWLLLGKIPRVEIGFRVALEFFRVLKITEYLISV